MRNFTNPTYKLTSLPEIQYDYIFVYDYEKKEYVKSYTGTIFRRPGTQSAGIMWHYAFLYGVDKAGVIWVISNDVRGVECLSLKDFMEDWETEDLEIEPIISDIYKDGIMKRAIERCNKPFHLRLNNCEKFVNYAVYNENDIGWQTKFFDFIAQIFFLPFDYQVEMSCDEKKLKDWTKFKRNIQKPKSLLQNNKD